MFVDDRGGMTSCVKATQQRPPIKQLLLFEFILLFALSIFCNVSSLFWLFFFILLFVTVFHLLRLSTDVH